MKYQKNIKCFEFFGIDVLVDSFGKCWIVEANRLPGLESSKQNKVEEDHMYDTMMMELLADVADLGENSENNWKPILESEDTAVESKDTWKNLFAWKAFTRKHRDTLVIKNE